MAPPGAGAYLLRMRSPLLRLVATACSAGLALALSGGPADAADGPTARERWKAYEASMRAGDAARRTGDAARAESSYREAIEHSRAFGERNLRFGRAVEALADLYREAGRLDEAETRYVEAIAVWERLLGPGQPHVATSLHNLAVVHLERNEPARARPLLERAIAIWEATRGPDSLELAASLEALAVLLQRDGRRDDARPLLERVERIRDRQTGGAGG